MESHHEHKAQGFLWKDKRNITGISMLSCRSAGLDSIPEHQQEWPVTQTVVTRGRQNGMKRASVFDIQAS